MFHTIPYPPVPGDTARAAGSLYGKGNIYLRLGDGLNDLLSDLIPIELKLPAIDQNTLQTKIQYAMLTIFQFAEELTNQQMVEALRNRVDLKYALHLPVNYHRFEPSDLCEFRRQLFADTAFQQIFQKLLDRTAEFGLLTTTHSQPVLTQQVLDAVCTVTRFEEVVEAMHQALETLAVTNPEWLRQVALPYWYDRYSRRTRMPSFQNSEGEWLKKALQVGSDIQYLLGEIAKMNDPRLSALPEITGLRRVWDEQFLICIDPITQSREMQWRLTRCASCNQAIDQLRRCNDQSSNNTGFLSNPNSNSYSS